MMLLLIGCMEILFLILGATIFWPGLIIALPIKNTLPIYLSTLANSTLIILFYRNFEIFQKKFLPNQKKIVNILRNISFVEINVSKLIN
jgi:hypothetical protein